MALGCIGFTDFNNRRNLFNASDTCPDFPKLGTLQCSSSERSNVINKTKFLVESKLSQASDDFIFYRQSPYIEWVLTCSIA